MSTDPERPGRAPAAEGPAQPAARGSNAPLIVILVVVGLILLGTLAYAFMMQVPGSMPGMNH